MHQEGEAPFESEVEISASSSAETQMDAMAQVAVAETNHGSGEIENIEQILCQHVANANESINHILV